MKGDTFMGNEPIDWRQHGVRIVRAGRLDSNTPQRPALNLDIPPVEAPEAVHWGDSIHPAPGSEQ